MKNLLSIFILSSIFFSFSCSNAGQNQKIDSNEQDTGVLIASNEQNLIVDSQESYTEKEVEIQTQVNEAEVNTQTKIPKKSKNNIPPQKAETESTLNNEMEDKKTEVIDNQEVTVVEKEETKEVKKEEATLTEPPFSHELWDQLLRKYVSTSGKANYKGFKSEKASLEAYLKNLDENPIQSSWSKAKKMAYWINAYNAFTIKLIVDNYPVSSITKLHGGKPWDVKWIKLGGKTYTLNNIENDILRPKYKDARIHFAVNCAAKSCPPILNQAWTENNLNQLLEKQAKAFINNLKFNSISSNEVEISKIFEWYAVDFGNIVDYLNKYSTTKINKNAKVKYKEYDWALNE